MSTGLEEVNVSDMSRDQMFDVALHREFAEVARTGVRERPYFGVPPVFDECFSEGALMDEQIGVAR